MSETTKNLKTKTLTKKNKLWQMSAKIVECQQKAFNQDRNRPPNWEWLEDDWYYWLKENIKELKKLK